MSSSPALLLKDARLRSGLSQRELARRAGTSQSVVARIELGETSPSWDTLDRLLAAAGFALDVRLLVRPIEHSHMLADVARIRALTPEQRLAEVANLGRFDAAVRRG
jgi:transcriptional regulator with XRE-family HTH domain